MQGNEPKGGDSFIIYLPLLNIQIQNNFQYFPFGS